MEAVKKNIDTLGNCGGLMLSYFGALRVVKQRKQPRLRKCYNQLDGARPKGLIQMFERRRLE
jgi:hypothetical protein